MLYIVTRQAARAGRGRGPRCIAFGQGFGARIEIDRLAGQCQDFRPIQHGQLMQCGEPLQRIAREHRVILGENHEFMHREGVVQGRRAGGAGAQVAFIAEQADRRKILLVVRDECGQLCLH